MRKIIMSFALTILLAGIPLLADAATTTSSSSSSSTAASNTAGRPPIINGRRANSKNIRHFRHKNRSMEPADDNKAPIPGAPKDQSGSSKNGTGSKKHFWQSQ